MRLGHNKDVHNHNRLTLIITAAIPKYNVPIKLNQRLVNVIIQTFT